MSSRDVSSNSSIQLRQSLVFGGVAARLRSGPKVFPVPQPSLPVGLRHSACSYNSNIDISRTPDVNPTCLCITTHALVCRLIPARMPFATDSVTKYVIFQEKSLPLPEGRLEGRTVIVTGSNRYVVVVFPLRLH
jgi:hypothetical protein